MKNYTYQNTLIGKNINMFPNGDSIKLLLQGRFAIIDFWGTWCKPCIEALPLLESVHKKASDMQMPLQIIGIAYETDSTFSKLNKFLDDRKIGWPQFREHDKMTSDFSLTKSMSISSFPSSILIDPDGTILGKGTGEIAFLEMIVQIEELTNKEFDLE